MLIKALKYDQYGLKIIGDFKMIAILMGLQGGFIKFNAIFAFGIVGIPKGITLSGSDHIRQILLRGRAIEKGNKS